MGCTFILFEQIYSGIKPREWEEVVMLQAMRAPVIFRKRSLGYSVSGCDDGHGDGLVACPMPYGGKITITLAILHNIWLTKCLCIVGSLFDSCTRESCGIWWHDDHLIISLWSLGPNKYFDLWNPGLRCNVWKWGTCYHLLNCWELCCVPMPVDIWGGPVFHLPATSNYHQWGNKGHWGIASRDIAILETTRLLQSHFWEFATFS